MPWFELTGWPVYYPPTFFWWWYFYDAYARATFYESAVIDAFGGFASPSICSTVSRD